MNRPQTDAAACCADLEQRLRPQLFRALADPTRLAVLARLSAAPRPLGVGEVASCCGVHLSGVSRHLAILRDAGIVAAERRGRGVLYRLDRSALSATLRGLADAIERSAAVSWRENGEP